MQKRMSIADVARLAGDPSHAGRTAILDLIARIIAELDQDSARQHGGMLSEIVAALSLELEVRVRRDFANRVADLDFLPRPVAFVLASDTVEVARPVLTRSRSLSDADLIALVDTLSDDHLSAIALRAVISDFVCDALVAKGSDTTLEILASNRGASLSPSAVRNLVRRARRQTRLAAILARRTDREPEVVQALYTTVETGLHALLSDQTATAAQPRAGATGSWRIPAAEAAALAGEISRHKVGGRLPHDLLIRYLREGRQLHFCMALGETLGVSHPVMSEILERQDARALAALCKTAGVRRQTYTTIGVLALHGSGFRGRLADLGAIFDDLSPVQAGALRREFTRPQPANVVPLPAAEPGRSRPHTSGDQDSAIKLQ